MAEGTRALANPADAPGSVSREQLVPPNSRLPPGNVLRQIDLFTGKAERLQVEVPPPPEEGQVHRVTDGISVVSSESGETVLLTGFGLFLGKKSERLTVRAPGGDVIFQFPFFRLSEVVLASRGISLSSDLVEALCERGIRIAFLKGGRGGGEPYALIQSPGLGATVRTRREQLLSMADHRGLSLCRSIVEGKIRNQRALLLYFGRYLKASAPPRYETLKRTIASLKEHSKKATAVVAPSIDSARGTLMGIEGSASRLYWDAVTDLVKEKATFLGRERRGASDELNSLLNYGYGILYASVWGAISNAGLDPFAGFLHVDRPGKPSLVLDLVEEFRQPIVDRVAIAHVNLGEPIRMSDGMLDEGTRAAFAGKVLGRLEAKEPFEGKTYQVRSIIQMQARHVATFLRGERDRYRPFHFKW